MIDVPFFNVGKAMNSQQCQETAFLLYEEYKHETIEDVVMMFKMAKKGMLGDGQVYNRIDGNVILGWMKEYREKKAIERENFVLNKRFEEKNNQTNVIALMEENEKPFDKDEFYRKGKEFEEERKREEQAKKDEKMCRMTTMPKTGARARCWASVQDRYGACKAGQPLPPLVMW